MPGDEGNRRPRSCIRSPARWLLLFGIAYFVVALTLSYVRFLEFTTSNWDLGIFEQSLWTTSHGFVFFEAGDFETYGTASFLQVHPALVLYALVPLYSVLPSVLTLFTVQTAAVTLAALPIYGIGRAVIGRPGPALAITGLFLVSTPLLVANLYDFHLESFIPLEIGVVFYLWLTGRYRWGGLAAAVSMATLEVMPFMIGAIALYFLIPPVRESWRQWKTRRALGEARRGERPWGRWFAQRSVRYSAGLLAACVLGYVVLRVFEWFVLPALLGLSATPPAAGGPADLASAGLALSFAPLTGGSSKVTFWLAMLAVFAFLPLAAPRALLLVLPWFLFTVQSAQIVWSTVGYQYTFLPIAPLAIAAIYGYRALEQRYLPRLATAGRTSVRRAARRWLGPAPDGGVRPRLVLAGAVLLVLVAGNLATGPLNPLNQHLDSPLSGYQLSYEIPPGFNNVLQLTGLLPPDAHLLASDNVFPLVADDPNAYALLWTDQQPARLPFNSSHLPQFVLLSHDQMQFAPGWLAAALGDPTAYGLEAVAYPAPTGSVFLWQAGYHGSLATYGTPLPDSASFGASALQSIGPGAFGPAVGAPEGTAVETRGINGTAFVRTPPVDYRAGTYLITVDAILYPGPQPASAGEDVLEINLSTLGNPHEATDFVDEGALGSTSWTELNFPVASNDPLPYATITATLLLPGPTLGVASVTIALEEG